MKSEPIQARFIVDWYDRQGRPFFFASDIAQIQSFGLPRDDDFGSSNVTVGSILIIEGRKYEVREMEAHILDKTRTIKPVMGYNTTGNGEDFPFNFQFRLYVSPTK